jgi:hypothetical protein
VHRWTRNHTSARYLRSDVARRRDHGYCYDKSLTVSSAPFETLQLVCKPSVVQAGSTALRVRIVPSKARR